MVMNINIKKLMENCTIMIIGLIIIIIYFIYIFKYCFIKQTRFFSMNTSQSSRPAAIRSHLKIGYTGTVISNVHCPFDGCEWFSGNGSTREINGKLKLHVKVCKKCPDKETAQDVIRQIEGKPTMPRTVDASKLEKKERIVNNNEFNDILCDFIDTSRDKKKLENRLKYAEKFGDEEDVERNKIARELYMANEKMNHLANIAGVKSFQKCIK